MYDDIIWRMHIACWMPQATDTHQEYVVLIAFPLPQRLLERASVLCVYVHCLSCCCFMSIVCFQLQT